MCPPPTLREECGEVEILVPYTEGTDAYEHTTLFILPREVPDLPLGRTGERAGGDPIL